jgi:hypothetical protein
MNFCLKYKCIYCYQLYFVFIADNGNTETVDLLCAESLSSDDIRSADNGFVLDKFSEKGGGCYCI